MKRLLCNAFMQPYFDYIYSTWYPNLTTNAFQATKAKCMCFYNHLDKLCKDKLKHLSHEVFECLTAYPWLIDSNNVLTHCF